MWSNTKQQSQRFELANYIVSFRERLLSFAQYNMEEMDEETKKVLYSLIHSNILNQSEDTLVAWTEDTSHG